MRKSSINHEHFWLIRIRLRHRYLRTPTITRPQAATARPICLLAAALVHGDVGLPTRQIKLRFLAGFNINKLQ
jgi:hypothetical protein